jgi:Tfp pilus assembly protein PilN
MKQINLLPWREQQARKKRIDSVLLVYGVLFLIALLIGSWRAVLSYQIKKIDIHKGFLVERLDSISLSIKKLQQIKQQVDQLQTASKRLHSSRTELRKALVILENIKIVAPSDFFIKTITYEPSYLLIVGSIESKNIFLALMRKLKEIDNGHFKWSYKMKQTSYFEFTLHVDLAESYCS